jgi:hypothetical protein
MTSIKVGRITAIAMINLFISGNDSRDTRHPHS